MDWTAIFQSALITLITAVIGIATKFLIDLIKKGVTLINERIGLIKDEKLKAYCVELMQAAETMKEILLNGSQKKQWVIDRLVVYAKENNIPITEEAISNLIQSIFQELDGITLNTYKLESDTVDTELLEEIISSAVNNAMIASTDNPTIEQ